MYKKEKILYHITRDGDKIKLTDLTTSHLINILKWIEKKSVEGLLIRSGGGSCPDDFWMDEEEFFGEEAKIYLNYYDYVEELNNRSKRI